VNFPAKPSKPPPSNSNFEKNSDSTTFQKSRQNTDFANSEHFGNTGICTAENATPPAKTSFRFFRKIVRTPSGTKISGTKTPIRPARILTKTVKFSRKCGNFSKNRRSHTTPAPVAKTASTPTTGGFQKTVFCAIPVRCAMT